MARNDAMQNSIQPREIELREIPEQVLELVTGGEAIRIMAPVDDP
jgi:hypothetical protein